MEPGEQKALSDIAEFGCHIMHVMAEGDLPPFSYSIGIERSASAPELAVIGLKQPLAHSIINEYNSRVKNGERFKSGDYASGFIEGFDCRFQEVEPSYYCEYFGWDIWLYHGMEFRVLQLVYPDTSGNWPDEPGASAWFKNWQVLLNRPT